MSAYVCLDLRCPYEWIQIKKLSRIKEMVERGDVRGISVCYDVETPGDVRDLFKFIEKNISKDFCPPTLFHIHEQNEKKMLKIMRAATYIIRKAKKENKKYKKMPIRILSWYNFAHADGAKQ